MVIVDAPFAMEPIKECVFPEQDFSIVDYGAVKGGGNSEYGGHRQSHSSL